MIFVFYVYDSDNKGYITKEEMEKVLAASGTDDEKQTQKQAIEECFKHIPSSGKLTFKEWKKWVGDNKASGLPLIGWIYENVTIEKYDDTSSDEEDELKKEINNTEQKQVDLMGLGTPFSQEEITFLSKQYDKFLEQRPFYYRSKKGGDYLDRATVMKLFSPPLPELLARSLFTAFSKEDYVDLKDFIVGVSMCIHASDNNKLSFIFKIFDTDKDKRLSREEFHELVKLIYQIEDTITSLKKKKILKKANEEEKAQKKDKEDNQKEKEETEKDKNVEKKENNSQSEDKSNNTEKSDADYVRIFVDDAFVGKKKKRKITLSQKINLIIRKKAMQIMFEYLLTMPL